MPDPVQTQRKEKERAERDTNIVRKIKEFIQERGFSSVLTAPCALHDDRKVVLERKEGLLHVQHRGHNLQVSCHTVDIMDKLETELRAWCKAQLPHTKVFPRKH